MASEIPLRSTFTLWILDDQLTSQLQPTQSFIQKLKPVVTFATIQQFWQVFQYMNKPSKITVQSDISIFRDNIKPLWQDPLNQKGGYYNIKIQKQKIDKIWQNTVFSLISPIKQISTCINGVRVKIKQQFCNLQIWMNSKASENLQQIKQYLKQSLQIIDDRIFSFFSFSYMIKGIKGKQTGNKEYLDNGSKQFHSARTKNHSKKYDL